MADHAVIDLYVDLYVKNERKQNKVYDGNWHCWEDLKKVSMV